MDRILKERYRYVPQDRLETLATAVAAVAQAPGWSRVEVELDADGRLYRSVPATAAEIGEWTASEGMAERLQIGDDPLLAANLAVPDERVRGVRIDIPDRFRAEGVLYLHLRYPAGGGSVQRHTIRVGRDAAVRIAVYHHPFPGEDERAVVDALTCVEAEAGAEVEIIEVVETRASYFGTVLCRQHRDSRVKMTTVDLDNRFLRRNQFVMLAEPGAECQLEGAYLADGGQRVDNYVRMHHAVAHCTSGQLFKGVVADEARAAFTGHIYVAPGAQQTVALQENHNVVLSNGARVDTRPQLEIYADDVRCNHGATVGRLDPEAIYYMRQRGIGLEAAKRLQIEGFIDEIVDRNRSEDLGHLLREKIAGRLHHI